MNKEKNSQGKEYEILTMNVYVELLKKYPGTKVELRKKIVGKSEVPREIDIYTEISIGPHLYKTAIECKEYKNNIGIEKVQEFLGKLQDLNIDKGILVTKCGYTESAIKLAKEHGIDLVELRQPTEEDWENRVKKIQIQIYYPEIFDIELKTEEKNLVGKKIAGWSNELILVDKNGNPYKNLNEIIQENIKNDWNEEQKTVNVNFDKSYFLEINNSKTLVKGISFKYFFHKTPQEIVLDGEKIVELIIKNAFTDEIRTINKVFEISNSKGYHL